MSPTICVSVLNAKLQKWHNFHEIKLFFFFCCCCCYCFLLLFFFFFCFVFFFFVFFFCFVFLLFFFFFLFLFVCFLSPKISHTALICLPNKKKNSTIFYYFRAQGKGFGKLKRTNETKVMCPGPSLTFVFKLGA